MGGIGSTKLVLPKWHFRAGNLTVVKTNSLLFCRSYLTHATETAHFLQDSGEFVLASVTKNPEFETLLFEKQLKRNDIYECSCSFATYLKGILSQSTKTQ